MGKFVPKLHFIILTVLIFSFVPSSFLQANDKKQAQICRDRGYEAQRAGNLDAALGLYKKAIELDPSYVVAYNDLGIILESKGDIDAAKEAYSQALKIDPKYLSTYYNLASLYEKKGNYSQALYYLRMRVKLGDWSDAWTWKAKERIDALVASGLAEAKSEAVLTKKELKTMPDAKHEARYHYYRGRQYLVVGNYVSALKELNAAIVLDPQNHEIEELLNDTQHKVLLSK